jgi:glycosyltransferase involved in cell wall biosynthesis
MNVPLISVVMASYNHEAYVREAIESVLAQKNVRLEFLIGDDGSKDKTCEIIRSYTDERLVFTQNEVNIGQYATTNRLIESAKGKYIAILNSDDFWHDDEKLIKQLSYMESNPKVGACFSHARMVDKSSKPSNSKWAKVFNQTNRSRADFFRYFFQKGNILCHPSVLMLKECHDKLGLYDYRLRQAADFDMWIKIIKHYDIHLLEQQLVSFRHIEGENASSHTPENTMRVTNELYLLGKSFFDDLSPELLSDFFPEIVKYKPIPSENHLEIEKIFCYFSLKPKQTYRLVGLEKMYHALGDPVMRDILQNEYKYTLLNYHRDLAETIALIGRKKFKLKLFLKAIFIYPHVTLYKFLRLKKDLYR